MKKVQKFILGLVVLLAFGCGKDDDKKEPEPTPISTSCVVTQVQTKDNSDVFLENYEYDAQNRIIKESTKINGMANGYTTVAYNSIGQPVKTISYDGSGVTDSSTMRYNGAGLLNRKNTYRQINFPGPIVLTEYETFEYDAAKKLIKRNVFYGNNSVNEYVVYTYPSANAAKLEFFEPANGQTAVRMEEYTFDNNKKPFNTTGLFWDDFMFTDHNPVTRKSTYYNPSDVSNATYTYEYNAFGYPTKETETVDGTMYDPVLYTYTCQ